MYDKSHLVSNSQLQHYIAINEIFFVIFVGAKHLLSQIDKVFIVPQSFKSFFLIIFICLSTFP